MGLAWCRSNPLSPGSHTSSEGNFSSLAPTRHRHPSHLEDNGRPSAVSPPPFEGAPHTGAWGGGRHFPPPVSGCPTRASGPSLAALVPATAPACGFSRFRPVAKPRLPELQTAWDLGRLPSKGLDLVLCHLPGNVRGVGVGGHHTHTHARTNTHILAHTHPADPFQGSPPRAVFPPPYMLVGVGRSLPRCPGTSWGLKEAHSWCCPSLLWTCERPLLVGHTQPLWPLSCLGMWSGFQNDCSPTLSGLGLLVAPIIRPVPRKHGSSWPVCCPHLSLLPGIGTSRLVSTLYIRGFLTSSPWPQPVGKVPHALALLPPQQHVSPAVPAPWPRLPSWDITLFPKPCLAS
ncbi:uncharacterized protein LOC125173067 [Prionailurus viverrinus]|uniref:uncharacterized protein LOC125173067 n=1 Tax=Prionailurus viverrinus TaxID=61388 RepID=UPI001FF172E7|nr:uncharacterized protein LOC125173067 [Prionailurus viverrinus]XP_047727821.1 uncharacterized protein LOC125173067 [Prionailurus viverrinus]